MNKLLKAGIVRYLRSILFWFGLFIAVILAVITSSRAETLHYIDNGLLILYIVLDILITWIIGREFGEGVIKNKVVCGHTKGEVFLSEILLSVIFSEFFFLLTIGIFTATNRYIFEYFALNILAKLFFDFIFITASFAVLFTVITHLTHHRTIAVIINTLLIFAMMFAENAIDQRLSEPEFNVTYDYKIVETVDKNGNVYEQYVEVEGSEVITPNPDYLGGRKRTAARFAYDILPMGNIYDDFVLINNAYVNAYRQKIENDSSQVINKQYSVQMDDNTNLNSHLIYTPSVIIVMTALGYLIFRKKYQMILSSR